jgi:hypothetical protein
MAARAFPLDRDTFLARLPIWEQSFELSEHVEMSGLADGSILTDAIGPRLWRGKCSIDLLPTERAGEVEALISLLQGPARSFLVWRLDRAFPKLDPDGAALSGSTPIITDLPTDARELRIGGLPVGYPLHRGLWPFADLAAGQFH